MLKTKPYRERKEAKERRSLHPFRQVTAIAEHKDNCINSFPIRHRNSRSSGLITLLKDSATPYSATPQDYGSR